MFSWKTATEFHYIQYFSFCIFNPKYFLMSLLSLFGVWCLSAQQNTSVFYFLHRQRANKQINNWLIYCFTANLSLILFGWNKLFIYQISRDAPIPSFPSWYLFRHLNFVYWPKLSTNMILRSLRKYTLHYFFNSCKKKKNTTTNTNLWWMSCCICMYDVLKLH